MSFHLDAKISYIKILKQLHSINLIGKSESSCMYDNIGILNGIIYFFWRKRERKEETSTIND